MSTRTLISARSLLLLLLTTTAAGGTFGENPIGPAPPPSSSLQYITAQLSISAAEAVLCDQSGTDPVSSAQVIDLNGMGLIGEAKAEHCTLRLLDAQLRLVGGPVSGPGSFDVVLSVGDWELPIPAADEDEELWLEWDPSGEGAIINAMGGGLLVVSSSGDPEHDGLVDSWVEEAVLAL